MIELHGFNHQHAAVSPTYQRRDVPVPALINVHGSAQTGYQIMRETLAVQQTTRHRTCPSFSFYFDFRVYPGVL
ncbi:hypothetical protein PFLUV_G00135980 [Perca fluviatilis]|uniref:Uncharacterized protein n=1 Tax=Perca fluviatilis TaxID=8168 RepID=A0A6A5EXS4_PERFL|nr:hypothetical protein PFLUV_G00135980 [Perca fluviatilis]